VTTKDYRDGYCCCGRHQAGERIMLADGRRAVVTLDPLDPWSHVCSFCDGRLHWSLALDYTGRELESIRGAR